MQTTTLELFKEEMKFSAGHFTIFSATDRENLHGHNFTVYVALEAGVVDGMMADYGIYKRLIIERCKAWNETFLLPTLSAHLRITETPRGVDCVFAGEAFSFLRRDVTLLPAHNITLEELSRLFGENLIDDAAQLARDRIHSVVVKCGSGPGQFASWAWRAA
jgi:6-pyruvoyltetrahydropterin/6-carboxytetrahydropterin synthase